MNENNVTPISATATVAVASSTPAINKSYESLNYIFDIVVILLLLVLIITKPKNTEKVEKLTEEEKPNPLEQVLRTDQVDDENKNKE